MKITDEVHDVMRFYNKEKHDAERSFGLSGTYSLEDVRHARREYIKKNHPDLASVDDKEAANKKMAEANAAFDLLEGLFERTGKKVLDCEKPMSASQMVERDMEQRHGSAGHEGTVHTASAVGSQSRETRAEPSDGHDSGYDEFVGAREVRGRKDNGKLVHKWARVIAKINKKIPYRLILFIACLSWALPLYCSPEALQSMIEAKASFIEVFAPFFSMVLSLVNLVVPFITEPFRALVLFVVRKLDRMLVKRAKRIFSF